MGWGSGVGDGGVEWGIGGGVGVWGCGGGCGGWCGVVECGRDVELGGVELGGRFVCLVLVYILICEIVIF